MNKDCLNEEELKKLKNFAKDIKINAVKMTCKSGASHIGAILSLADIMATLYGKILHYNVKNPKDENRDIFILSKGHAGVAQYCALAEIGMIDKKDLEGYYTYGSLLSGHVSHKVRGAEVSTGSLGHGLGLAVGIAYSFKLDKKDNQVYVLMGDGECEEGSVWEAVMLAVQLKLDNLHVIVDRNNMQALGDCKDIIDLNNLEDKFKAFGFNVLSCDGHNFNELVKSLSAKCDNKPSVVVAHTVKGKGVSFMENNILWHYRNPNQEQAEQAIKELEDYYA